MEQRRRGRDNDEAGANAGRRLRSGRGAAGVEYVLILSLVVVGAIGSVGYVESRSKEEVVDHSNCVSMRPPPANCRPDPVTKPPIPGQPADPPVPWPSDAPFSPTDDPAQVPPQPPGPPSDPSTAAIPATVPNPAGGADLVNPYGAVNPGDATKWGFSLTVNIQKPDPVNPGLFIPAEGAIVVIEYWGDGASGELQHLTLSCAADAAGNCTITDFNYGYSVVTAVHIDILYIASSPGVAGLPSPSGWDITRP